MTLKKPFPSQIFKAHGHKIQLNVDTILLPLKYFMTQNITEGLGALWDFVNLLTGLRIPHKEAVIVTRFNYY
jgi:hypothetical protein